MKRAHCISGDHINWEYLTSVMMDADMEHGIQGRPAEGFNNLTLVKKVRNCRTFKAVSLIANDRSSTILIVQ